MKSYLAYLMATLVCLWSPSAVGSSGIPAAHFPWPGEKNAAAWELGKDVSVESKTAPKSGNYLRCGFSQPAEATFAILKGVKVKPERGYIARCRVRADGSGAQLTFALLKSSGTSTPEAGHGDEFVRKSTGDLTAQGLSFFVSRDEYIGGAFGEWEEVELPFRTEAGQSEVALYMGRRYGAASILYQSVELIEDDSVKIGEIAPLPRSLPPLETQERERGYLVSRQSWMEPAFGGHRPSREEITDQIACWLSPGQYEPVTVSLTGLRALNKVSVRLEGDLKGEKGNLLAAEKVKVSLVRTVTRWLTNSAPLSPGQRYEKRPIYLLPNEATKLAEGETKTWWLTVHAQESQPPDHYRGRVIITAEGGSEYAIDLAVEVLPIRLSPPEVTYGMFYRHLHQAAGFQTDEMFLRAAKDMAEHGMNSITIYTHLERPVGEGLWKTDLDYDSDRSYSFSRQMQLLEQSGLLSSDHPLLLLPSHGGHDTIRDYSVTLPLLNEQQRKRGWPEFLILLYDEVGGKPHQWEALDREMEKIAQVRKKQPDLGFRLASTAPDSKAHYFDVIIRGDKLPGKEMWTYNCTWNGAVPVNDRYFAGFHTWSEGLLGNWQWCYTEGRQLKLTESGEIDLGELSAYVDPLYNNYVLPAEGFNVPTLGWEARRAGVDDYRYLQTLREAVAVAKKSEDSRKTQLAREAQAFLDAAGEKMKAPPATRSPSQINSVKAYLSIMNPDLSVNDYNEIRREAAEWIVQLTQ